MQRKVRTRAGSMLLVTAMLLGLLPAGALAAEPSFADTESHWAESAIERWSGYGVVEGRGDGTFAPDAELTRAEMAQIYVNLLNLTEKADISKFADVPADAWYADAIAKCVAAGIINGTGDATASPMGLVTREQMFVTFARALGMASAETTDSTLSDLNQVSDWAKDAVNALLNAGYVTGTGNNTLLPLANIDRASVMALLDKSLAGYSNQAGTTVKVENADGLVLVVNGGVTVTGKMGDLVIAEGAAKGSVTLKDATVTGTVTLAASDAELNLTGDTKVENLVVSAEAKNGEITVDKGASVVAVTTAAEGTTVSGDGTVTKVEAAEGSSNVTVTTSGTTVENNGSGSVTTDKGEVKPGETTTTTKPSTGGSSGGGSSSGGSTVTTYTITFAANGGSGTMDSVSVTSGTAYTLPDCTFAAPANQKFKAWKVGETEYAVGATITVSGNITVTAVWEDTASKQAVDAAWTQLNGALAGITGNSGAQIVTAAGSNGAYTLTLDVDAIQATDGAFEDNQLTGLATAVKNALDAHFGSYTLTMDDQKVYDKGVFQNTALKNALFSVADGFFYTLGNMTAVDGVYTYKTVNAQAAGTDTYDFTVAVQLKGSDVEKVQSLAATLADHLAMEKLSATEIENRYGLTGIGETEAVVVTMEMPDALMQTAADMVAQNGTSGDALQEIFDRQTVGTFLTILNNENVDLEAILGSGADEINSVLSTVNNNKNLINKVLGKLTVQVNDKNFFTTEHGTFTPGTEGDAYHKFMTGIYNMTSNDIKTMTPAQFKCTKGSMGGTYYAVPVTVGIDLDSSMGFTATETVVVVMHIDFSKYVDQPQEPEVNQAEQAVDAAWTKLNSALKEIKGNNGAQIVTADSSNGAYTLTLDVDAIQAAEGAFTDDQLTGLATAVKNALDEHFGDYTLTVDGQAVYANEVFNNTALKNALFSVADGFFYTLGNMTAVDGVYTYKTVNAKATGTDSYDFTIDVQLKGDDVAKVQRLAKTLADHLAMEKLSATEIERRYGLTGIGENEAVVVTMEMPDALMQKAAEIAADKGITGENMQAAFDRQTVGTFLTILNNEGMDLDAILNSGAAEINSVLSTVNNNKNLINKVLGKLTVTVTAKDGTTAQFGKSFDPTSGSDAYHNFMDGVIGMTSDGIKGMTPGQFKSTGSKGGTYYAVPVTVAIDLESSMGFSATETVVVVMHIDFSKYISDTNAQG